MTETISDRLRRARELAGLSLQQAAKLLDEHAVDPGHCLEEWCVRCLRLIECDSTLAGTLSVQGLLSIAQIYKVSPSWLLEGASKATLDKIRDRIFQVSRNIPESDIENAVQIVAMMPKGE